MPRDESCCLFLLHTKTFLLFFLYFCKINNPIGVGKTIVRLSLRKANPNRMQPMKQNDDIRSLYEQHRDRMLSLARFLLGDGEESRDVVSDVFASLLERPSADVSHPASFLLITVRNRCLNLLSRKQMKERAHKLLPIDEPTDDELPQDDQLEAMLRFIDTELTPKTRKVVHLRFEEHMTYRDIASHLGISEAAVYKHLAQAIRKLKQRFNP